MKNFSNIKAEENRDGPYFLGEWMAEEDEVEVSLRSQGGEVMIKHKIYS